MVRSTQSGFISCVCKKLGVMAPHSGLTMNVITVLPRNKSRIGKGVAIFLGPQATKAWRTTGERIIRYGERIVAVQLELMVRRKKHHVRIVSAYAPHSGYSQDERAEYLSQLQACINDCPTF